MKWLKLFLLILFLPGITFASVVINEICWMGNATSANDEWIELYNPDSENVKIDDWILKTADDGIKINLKGEIPAMSFFLLERTDDNSAPNIKADLIYQGALSNNGEILKLIDSNKNIVDEVNCSFRWLAGDNKTKQTMERVNSDWQTSQNPNGTPKATNSIKQITNNENLADLPAEVLTKAGRQGLIQNAIPSNIFISEILSSPEGSDTENEFIEIFNANNFEADISGFKIKDRIGAVKTYVIPKNTKINANGFLSFKSSQTKISLNNTGDGVELLDPSGKIIDSTDFGKSQQGQSWSKTENVWQWTAKPTPGQTNIILIAQIASTSTTKATLGPLTANIKNYTPQKKNFLAVGIATIIASVSALIAWRIKKNSTEV